MTFDFPGFHLPGRPSPLRTRIIRTRPDPDSGASDLVRQCNAPACLTVFTSGEAVVSVIETHITGNKQDKCRVVGRVWMAR